MGAKDDEVLTDLFGDCSFDLLAGGVVRKVGAGLGEIEVDDKTPLLGDGLEGVSAIFDGYLSVAAAEIPAKLLGKEGAQVEVVEMLFDAGAVEGREHGQFSSGPMRPSEQMIRGSRRSCSP